MKHVAVLTLMLLSSVPSWSDSWLFEEGVTDKEYPFADVRIVRTVDARVDQQYPDFIVSVYRQDELLAMYRNVSFDALFASEGDEFFVGLSNTGLPGTAIVVFDARGNLIREIKHRHITFDYCEESLTLSRVWFDDTNPSVEIRLGYGDNYIESVTLRDCRGRRVSLDSTITEGFKRYVEFKMQIQ